MRMRHHHDSVIVLDKGETIIKHTIVHEVADTANSLRQLILLDSAGLQSMDFVDVEAGLREVSSCLLVAVTHRLITCFEFRNDV